MEHVGKTMSRRTFVGVAATALASLTLGGCASAPEEPVLPAETPQKEPRSASSSPQTATESAEAPATEPAGTGNAVIAVFSRTGNTLALAETMQASTGLDLMRIEPIKAYPDDYDEMLDVGQREQDEDARPALADDVPSLAAYDTIYLGFSVWWGRIPQIVKTLADRGDLAGKTIAPFCTSSSSSIAVSVADLRALCPDANVLDGLTITETGLSSMDEAAGEWLAGLEPA